MDRTHERDVGLDADVGKTAAAAKNLCYRFERILLDLILPAVSLGRHRERPRLRAYPLYQFGANLGVRVLSLELSLVRGDQVVEGLP